MIFFFLDSNMGKPNFDFLNWEGNHTRAGRDCQIHDFTWTQNIYLND